MIVDIIVVLSRTRLFINYMILLKHCNTLKSQQIEGIQINFELQFNNHKIKI